MKIGDGTVGKNDTSDIGIELGKGKISDKQEKGQWAYYRTVSTY